MFQAEKLFTMIEGFASKLRQQKIASDNLCYYMKGRKVGYNKPQEYLGSTIYLEELEVIKKFSHYIKYSDKVSRFVNKDMEFPGFSYIQTKECGGGLHRPVTCKYFPVLRGYAYKAINSRYSWDFGEILITFAKLCYEMHLYMQSIKTYVKNING